MKDPRQPGPKARTFRVLTVVEQHVLANDARHAEQRAHWVLARSGLVVVPELPAATAPARTLGATPGELVDGAAQSVSEPDAGR